MRSGILLLLLAAQTPGPGLQTLRGGGLEITVDLTGWKLEQGAAILRGGYARLGLFSGANGQDISILVDGIPKGATDVNTLCQGAEESKGGSKAGIKILEAESVAGKPACLFTFPAAQNRRSLYVEMLVEGRWLEIHYSAPDNRNVIALAHSSLEGLVGSESPAL